MLHVALVGLLAGSLAVGSPDGGDAKKTTGDPPKDAPVAAETPGIFTRSAAPAAPQTVQDTYAFGRSDRNSPIRFWAHYGQSTVDEVYSTAGDTQNLTVAGAASEISARRVAVGTELGLPVGLFGFGLGVGGQLTLAENTITATGTPALTLTDSEFGLQNAKVYGIARTGALSLHGGYLFDLGDDTVIDPAAGITLGTSDGRDALFFGAGFDYPTNFIRLFGGLDYYDLAAGGNNNPLTPAVDESGVSGDDFINSVIGLGLRTSVIEVGAALQIQTRFSNPTTLNVGTAQGIGGSLATIAPYARISPPRIPATLFIKGAVLGEYTESGFPIGGANAVKPGASLGFTAGLTVGFQ